MSSPGPTPTPNKTANPQTEDVPGVKNKLIWNEQTEDLAASWGDIASCYKWLHDQAFHKYNRINYRMSIPIIVLSTITGTVSVGMASLVPAEYVNLAQQAVGGVNIITGIITTLQNFFRFAQLSEGHGHASLGWSKLERNIRIELKVDRKFRKDADSFLKVCRSDYDRLLEQSPVIPKEVIEKFKMKFRDIDLRKPDICDNLQTTEIAPVYTPIVAETPIDEEPDLSSNIRQEEILNEIKNLLSESRIVPIGMKDHEIPRWRAESTRTLAPRKSFLGAPKDPIDIDKGNINVKEMIRKFGGGTRESVVVPLVGMTSATGSATGSNADIPITIDPIEEKKEEVLKELSKPRPVFARSQTIPDVGTPTSSSSELVLDIVVPSIDVEERRKKSLPLMNVNDLI